jgi:hypothetical protein
MSLLEIIGRTLFEEIVRRRGILLERCLQANDLEAMAVTMHDRGAAADHAGDREEAQRHYVRRNVLQAEAKALRKSMLPEWSAVERVEVRWERLKDKLEGMKGAVS